jgi:hypothetical protein
LHSILYGHVLHLLGTGFTQAESSKDPRFPCWNVASTHAPRHTGCE